MADGKIKATVIKSVAALLCTAIAAYSGIANTNKICKNKMEISSAAAEKADNGTSAAPQESDWQYADTVTDETAPSDDFTADAESESGGAEVYDIPEDSTAAQSGSAQQEKTNSSSSNQKTEAAKKKITLTGGLSSNNKEEVLEYYKLVSKKNEKLLFQKTLTLVSIDQGKTLNISDKWMERFTSVAKKALAKNTVDNEPYPGKYENIRPSDWQSATAVNDGTYTTLNIKVVPQTDSYDGKIFEGTCGRSMSVLDGIDRALQDMAAFKVDFANTNMKIYYQNPVIKLKVKNATGELVKGGCEWSYRTVVDIQTMDSSFIGISISLKEAGGVVDYSVKY